VAEIALPSDLATAHAMILELHAQYHTLRGEYDDIKHQLDQMARRLYGRRSEQLDPAQLQLAFAALEAEMVAAATTVAPVAPDRSERAPTTRPGHGRRPLPKNLPRERRVIEPADDELVCTCCGRAKVRIGEEVAEQLEYVPASFKVIETVRPKYACSKCKDGVTVALAPRSPISKGLAGPGLLTHVIVSKYADHVPLSRLATIFKRLGIDIPRQTLCGWVEKVHWLLAAVEAAQWASILTSGVLGADETPVKVLELGRKQCARGYFWGYVGDQAEVVFDFSMGRGSEMPMRALKEYLRGVLVCDGYGGYDAVDRTKPDVVRAGCMAHARRKVFEAKDVDPDRALILLALIRQLYDVEDLIQAAACVEVAQRHALALSMRQETSRPVMARIEEHVERYRPQVIPKSPMGKALTYFHNQWTCLSRFLDNGAIPIDNNSVEREIRPIAVGRGNWTFIGHEDAGPWAARLYGLMGTCRLQGVNPYAWLKDVLERVRDHPPDRMYELAPRGWRLARAQAGEGGT
jgi:transposase